MVRCFRETRPPRHTCHAGRAWGVIRQRANVLRAGRRYGAPVPGPGQQQHYSATGQLRPGDSADITLQVALTSQTRGLLRRRHGRRRRWRPRAILAAIYRPGGHHVRLGDRPLRHGRGLGDGAPSVAVRDRSAAVLHVARDGACAARRHPRGFSCTNTLRDYGRSCSPPPAPRQGRLPARRCCRRVVDLALPARTQGRGAARAAHTGRPGERNCEGRASTAQRPNCGSPTWRQRASCRCCPPAHHDGLVRPTAWTGRCRARPGTQQAGSHGLRRSGGSTAHHDARPTASITGYVVEVDVNSDMDRGIGTTLRPAAQAAVPVS